MTGFSMSNLLFKQASDITQRASLGLIVVLALLSVAPTSAQVAGGTETTSRDLEARAMARLSGPQLRAYFASLSQMEQSASQERLGRLKALLNCLEFTRLRAGSDECMMKNRQARKQDRETNLRNLNALRSRYGLPMRHDMDD